MSDLSRSTRSAVAGSDRPLPAGAQDTGPANASERASVTILLHPRKSLPDVSASVHRVMSREEFAKTYGASEADIDAVKAFAKGAGLHVTGSDSARRSVEVSGTVAELEAAFGTKLFMYSSPGVTPYRGRTGGLTVPSDVAPLIAGVFGLDVRVQARTHFVRADEASKKVSAGLTAVAVANAYGFPAGDGAGQTIALIELGGGYTPADLATYFSGLAIALPKVSSVSVDAATNAPTGSANGPDAEVMLDIEVAGAVAPAAKIVVYFAPNTDRGFLDAITTAVHDTTNAPNVVSISWGGPESTWTAQATTSFDQAFAAAALLGVTVTVAAGDGGSSDGVTDGNAHVDFPASSPHALACGGTRLKIATTGTNTESVWNDGTSGGATGGGVSDVFALPAWQSAAKVPPSVNAGGHVGRGVPDVAGNADPVTGYRTVVDGSADVIGGTSAVAPLWAGLIARLNANAGKPLGFINPQLYAKPSALHDVTKGNNGAYAAAVGWDACTGLGSPNGAALATLFGATGAKQQ